MSMSRALSVSTSDRSRAAYFGYFASEFRYAG
jgi:hypothetical protein